MWGSLRLTPINYTLKLAVRAMHYVHVNTYIMRKYCWTALKRASSCKLVCVIPEIFYNSHSGVI